MHLDEAKKILKENGFLLEQFDNNYFSKCFKASKLNKLFSIERDNVFRLDGSSFWIVSNKNPGDKYLVRVGGKKLEQYVNGKKVDEIDFGDEYDIILIFKHKLETGKLVNFVNGEMIDYHMTEAKEILSENGYGLIDHKTLEYDKEYIEQLKNTRKYITKCSRNIKDASIKNKELDELYTNLNTCSDKLNKIIDNEIKHLEKIYD